MTCSQGAGLHAGRGQGAGLHAGRGQGRGYMQGGDRGRGYMLGGDRWRGYMLGGAMCLSLWLWCTVLTCLSVCLSVYSDSLSEVFPHDVVWSLKLPRVCVCWGCWMNFSLCTMTATARKQNSNSPGWTSSPEMNHNTWRGRLDSIWLPSRSSKTTLRLRSSASTRQEVCLYMMYTHTHTYWHPIILLEQHSHTEQQWQCPGGTSQQNIMGWIRWWSSFRRPVVVYYTVILQHIILYIQCYLYTTSPLLILWDAQQEFTCRQTGNLQTVNLQTDS